MRKQIAVGNYTEIAAAETRGHDHWGLICDHHAQDLEFERDIELQLANQLMPVLLNPARNLRKVVQVPKPQQEFDLPSVDTCAAMTQVDAARNFADTLKQNRERENLLLELLNSDTPTVEELEKKIGSKEEIRRCLKSLRRRKHRGLGVETVNGLVEFDQEKIASTIIRSEEKELAIVELLGVNPRARAGIEVTLAVESVDTSESSVRQALARNERVFIDTRNNVRTLKILEACRFLDLKIQAVLAWHIEAATGRRINTLTTIESESDVLFRLGPLVSYILPEDE